MRTFLRFTLPILALSSFLAIDQSLPQMPAWLRGVFFLPIEILLFLVRRMQIAPDYSILILLGIGIPLVLVYWYFAFRLLLWFFLPDRYGER